MTGQGTGLAVVGAYVLAQELAKDQTFSEAFAAYERLMRPYVEGNQATAHVGGSVLLPTTPEELELRNKRLRGELQLRPLPATSKVHPHYDIDLSRYGGGLTRAG